MKTIKELKEHIATKGCMECAYSNALKDVVKLIDELENEGYNKEAFIRKLKARIEG